MDHEPPKYVLTKNIESYNPTYVATHEYVAGWRDVKLAEKWSDKLKYIFYALGRHHDGTDMRAKTVRHSVKSNGSNVSTSEPNC